MSVDDWNAAIEAAAKIAAPETPQRKGGPGIWRIRRERIAADILALRREPERLEPTCWQVLEIDPETSERPDVLAAFRRLSEKVRPASGGMNAETERLIAARDAALGKLPE